MIAVMKSVIFATKGGEPRNGQCPSGTGAFILNQFLTIYEKGSEL